MYEFKPCPDFELGALIKFKPDIFETNDPNKKDLYGFMIGLALTFKSEMGNFLATIRNNVSSHYWRIGNFIKGYDRPF